MVSSCLDIQFLFVTPERCLIFPEIFTIISQIAREEQFGVNAMYSSCIKIYSLGVRFNL